MPDLEWVLRASWRGTAKLIKVKAPNQAQAMIKAARNRAAKGCWDLTIIECRPPTPTRKRSPIWQRIQPQFTKQD